MTEPSRQIQALAGWFAERLHAARDLPLGTRAGFFEALAGIAAARPAVAGGAPEELPVLHHLPTAFDRVAGNAAAATRPWLDALAASLRWTQNPNYRSTPPSADFLANYGYAQLAGPAGVPTLAVTDHCAFGLLLLGPGLLYPTHRHPAAELYLPLTLGAWQRGDEAWREVAPGKPIYHPPHMPHATRAGTEPMLALYLWLGELGTHAKLDAERSGRP